MVHIGQFLFRRSIVLFLTASFLITYVSPAVFAQQIDPSAFSGLQWRMIGPFRGGRVNGVSGVPGQPNTFYFGSVGGGVWKSGNSGRTWNPVFDDQQIASIGAIGVAPSAPNTVYVGTGEADMRSQISYGDGMYKSTDGGKTWTHIGLENTRQIGHVIVDPKNPNIVFVAALGHVYGANPDRGIFRSKDGGATWQKVLFKNENVGAIDLAFDPTNSQIVYATLWNTRRPPWSIYPPSLRPGRRHLQIDRRRHDMETDRTPASRSKARAASASPSRRPMRNESTQSSTLKRAAYTVRMTQVRRGR